MRIKMWLLIVVGVFLTITTTAGSKESTLYNFCSVAGCADGSSPVGLVADAVGNFYGVTAGGGSGITPNGTIFDLTPSSGGWTENVLYNFCSAPNCTDGAAPYGGLTIDSQGNLYGTTYTGGTASTCEGGGYGTVYELSPSHGSWIYTVLYSFLGGSNGSSPSATLTFDTHGNLYGTTVGGGDPSCDYEGESCGTVFELVHSASGWSQSVLYAFGTSGPNDGWAPRGETLDSNGNVYGTTVNGGPNPNCSSLSPFGYGVVYELSLPHGSWTENILYNFCSAASCFDGANPDTSLVFDSKGSLYGTTLYGGAGGGDDGGGTVFKLTPSNGGWTESVLYSFNFLCCDGNGPSGGVTFDNEGNIYGTTTYSRNNTGSGAFPGNCGAVYRLTPSGEDWAEKIFQFGGKDGAYPGGGVLIQRGSLYGTTRVGGLHDVGRYKGSKGGVVFRITP